MKLSHYTIRNLSVPLLIIMLLWASVFYFLIMHEINDETNDSLENYKELIIKRVLTDPEFEREHSDEMTRYRMEKVDPEEADLSKNIFYDSFKYIDIEMEYEPIRVLKSYFMDKEGDYYELVIETSTLEKEDMMRTVFWSIIGLYLALLFCILIVTHYVFKKSFNPFYELLNWLKSVHPGKKDQGYVMNTKVDEFITLNNALLESTRRNREIYNEQKQFVENAAHELQTPLAIVTNKLELLGENPDNTEEQLEEIGAIYKVLRQVIRMNKSLLLLSRIENRQYPDLTEVDFNRMVREQLNVFSEVYKRKSLKVVLEEKGKLSYKMNDSLALILISNLLKNAYVHNVSEGNIHVTITKDQLKIVNSSDNKALDEKTMFNRFNPKIALSESTGLGLAIIKSITLLYGIKVEYAYTEHTHHFRLKFKI